MTLSFLGTVNRSQCDLPSAQALHEESLAIFQKLSYRLGIAESLGSLAGVAAATGDYAAAQALHNESLTIRRDLGDRRGIAKSLTGLAYVTFALGLPERAARIWGAAERLREEIGSPLPPAPIDGSGYDRHMAVARATFEDEAAFGSARKEGRELTVERAIEFALEKTGAL